MDNITFDYGQSGSTTFSVNGSTVGLDDIEVVGHPEAVIVLNGNVIAVSGLDAGNYTMKVTPVPDGNHNSVERTVGVTVNKVDSTLELDNITFDYGKSGSTSAIVTGADLDLDNISVIGHDEAVIALSGNVITVSGLNAGNYTLKVTAVPDDNHNSVERTVGITVNKVDSSIRFSNNITFDFGGSGSTTVTVTGASISQNDIEVIDHAEANITLKDNVITVSDLKGGNYTLRVTTTPDDNHKSVVATLNVNVITVDTSVDVESNDISMKVGDEVNVNATLNPSQAGDLIYSSTNQSVVIVDSTGKVTAVGQGEAEIIIKFDGNGRYLPSQNKVKVKVSKIATEITSPDEISLYVDDKDSINATLVPNAGNLKYTVDDDSIVSIDENGIIRAINEGKTNITVSYAGDNKYLPSQDVVTVIVSRIPTEIIVDNTTLEMEVGNGMMIRPTLLPSSSVGYLVYESSDPETVEVQNGFIFTVKSGSANVTISYEGDYKYEPSNVTIYVTVKSRATNITVKDNVELVYGDSINLNATLNYPYLNSQLYYESSNPNVVGINQKGQITALNTGSAIITVKFNETGAFDGSTAEVKVTVNAKQTKLVLDAYDVSLNPNGEKTIVATLKNGPADAKLTYTSSNPNVATVDANGKITAVGRGDAVIKVNYAGDANYVGSSANIAVSVSSIPTEIIAVDSVSMNIDGTTDLNATLSPNVGALSYSTSDSSVVKVDSNGKLTALKTGDAVITISYAGNNKYDSSVKKVDVTVSLIPTSINVNETNKVRVERLVNLKASLTPDVGKLTYESSNTGIVKVDENGIMTGVTVGSATITIKYAGNSKYAKATAVVKVDVIKDDLSTTKGVVFDVSPQETATPSYSIRIPDDATGTLKVVVDGNKVYTAKVVNGRATVNVPALSKGNHTVDVTYSGNYKYVTLTKSSYVINPVYRIDKNKDVVMAYTGTGTYIAHLTKDTQALEGKFIKFVINDKRVRHAKTDSLGYAYITIDNMPLRDAPYTVTAEYADVKVSNKIYVKKSVTPSEASSNQLYKLSNNKDVVMAYTGTGTYTVRLTEDSIPLEGKFIKFVINDKRVRHAKTDSQGYATITIDNMPLRDAPYTITAEYENAKVSNKIYVKKSVSSSESHKYKLDKNSDVSMSSSGTGTYVVHLTDNSKALAGKFITFVINDKRIRHAKTDSLGYATLTIDNMPARAAPYTITAEYEDVKVTNRIYVS